MQSSTRPAIPRSGGSVFRNAEMGVKDRSGALCTRHVAPFPRLQSKHSDFRFSLIVSPPFDHGKSWSTSNTRPATVAGDRPHATQQNLSRFNTKNLRQASGCRKELRSGHPFPRLGLFLLFVTHRSMSQTWQRSYLRYIFLTFRTSERSASFP